MNKNSLNQAMQVYTIEKECIEKMAEYFDEDAYSKAMEKSNHIARIKDSINAAQIAAEMSLKCNNT